MMISFLGGSRGRLSDIYSGGALLQAYSNTEFSARVKRQRRAVRMLESPRMAGVLSRRSVRPKMKITAIHSTVVPIASAIRNAYIDFSKMTASVVAVVTDVVRDGKRVVGYGFNSNGRYAQSGVLAERFIPRILQAAPGSLLNDE